MVAKNTPDSVILPYEKVPAACTEWDPRAIEVARIVSNMIERSLPAVRVDHIGSTAIPGCAGKGIVDLQALYPAGNLESVKDLLWALGFQPQISRAPWPEDRPMRVGAIEYDGSIFRVHVHVVAADSEEATRLRAFRDRLRADPVLRDAYVARKRGIIDSGVTDTLDYALQKGGFVEKVLEHPSE